MKTRRLEHDLAYGCFLLCGLTVLAVSIIRTSYTDADWAGRAGAILLLLLPFLLASSTAMLVAAVLSIRLWRQWPLLVLAGISILLIRRSLPGMVRLHSTPSSISSTAW